jgi:hypothetical protein
MIKASKFAPRPLQARAASMPSALILCLMLLICAAPSAFGQKGTWRDGIDLIMRSVEDLNQKGASFKLTALPDASSGNWPGSFYAWRNGFRCSATLIGPKALLLPAQCMPDGGEVVIEFRGVRKAGTCKHSGTSNIGRPVGFCALRADYANRGNSIRYGQSQRCTNQTGERGVHHELFRLQGTAVQRALRRPISHTRRGRCRPTAGTWPRFERDSRSRQRMSER